MTEKKLVWDLPLRLFHWLFGLSIVAAWIAIENQQEQLHMYLGYFIIGLLVFRLVWGFVGTRHSQFRHFFPTPAKLTSYLCAFFNGVGANKKSNTGNQGNKEKEKEDNGKTKQTVGHNPLGSLMVFLMFALVGFQAISGLFLEGEMWSGPYAHTISTDMEETLNSLHHSNFTLIQMAILVHVLAVFGYLAFKKQNLITPMITGKKKSELVGEEGIKHSRLWIALILLCVTASFVYWLVFVAPPPLPPPPSNDALFLY